MTVNLAPNVQAIIVQFLRDQDEVDELCDGRVGSVVPPDPDLPFVRVVQFGQRLNGGDGINWSSVAELQVDAWADVKETAWRTAATCHAVLIERFRGLFDYGPDVRGVVTKVSTHGLRDLPDGTYAPARPRWSFTVSVWAHPVRTPDVSSS
jgi:hypothetical protein